MKCTDCKTDYFLRSSYGPTCFASPCYIVTTPLGLQSSEVRRRFAVHVIQTFRENVSFSPSGVQLSMKIGIDIPEERKPRLHRCDVFKFGWMCCVPIWILHLFYSTIAPCVDPVLSERDAVSGLWYQLTKLVAQFNVMDLLLDKNFYFSSSSSSSSSSS